MINNHDSEVWAHLALLCLVVGRPIEADQAIAQALHLGVTDPEVLRFFLFLTVRLVGLAFMEAKRVTASVEIFKLALENDPENISLRALFKKALNESGPIVPAISGLVI